MSQVDFFQTKLTVELSTFAAQSQAEQLNDVHQDPTNLIRKDYSAHLQLYNIKAKPPVPAMPPPTKMHEEAPLLWTHLVATHIVE